MRHLVALMGVAAAAALALVAPATASEESPPEWARRVHEVDQALAANDVGRSIRALQEAHVAALHARGWEGLVEVGSAALRIGDAVDNRSAGRRKARQCYLAALFRARGLGSLEGVVRATEAFAMLGDRDAVESGLRIAEALAARAPDARSLDRLDALRERLTERASKAGTTSIR
jgi:hypothetical protein